MASATGWPSTVADRLGLQARLTVTATTLVAVVLILGSALLGLLLQRTLIGRLDDSAQQRAADVAALIDQGSLPAIVPAAGGTVLVQVVDSRGRVRASTPGGDALVPILSGADLASVRRGATVHLSGSRIGVSDSLRVSGRLAGPRADRRTVLVAVSSDEAERTLRVALLVLVVGVPLLVAGFALVCWALVGAALRPAERRQRSFVADAAHELRSPLASIRTQLEVARTHPVRADWPGVADGVLIDVERLTRLVDDLLLLARLDDGRRATAAARGPVDVRLVARACVAAAGRRFDVELSQPDSEVLVAADPDAVRRVLDNLVSNADRHATSRVDVAVSRVADLAVLTVTDDGPGIPAEQRARVFERFTRLDGARAVGEGGSGLGLAIVRQLVAACGGTVTLDDACPGVRAVVRLPLAATTAASADA